MGDERMIRLVLGGEKSGKSDLAYGLFLHAPGAGMVMAMGQARDASFRRQILEHRLRRDPSVPLVEPGTDLAGALARAHASGSNVLVDSLDFWAFQTLSDSGVQADLLLQSLAAFEAPASPECILVSCEVGLGPIAPSSLARRFARELGALNQRLAALASDVRMVVAGLPIRLK
jgi:adenosylcobinamide kinase/adenosylcobinamide-phosphate guanylyltransferase